MFNPVLPVGQSTPSYLCIGHTVLPAVLQEFLPEGRTKYFRKPHWQDVMLVELSLTMKTEIVPLYFYLREKRGGGESNRSLGLTHCFTD